MARPPEWYIPACLRVGFAFFSPISEARQRFEHHRACFPRLNDRIDIAQLGRRLVGIGEDVFILVDASGDAPASASCCSRSPSCREYSRPFSAPMTAISAFWICEIKVSPDVLARHDVIRACHKPCG